MKTLTTTLLLLSTAAPALALTPDEVKALVATVDERQRAPGDFKANCYIEHKEKGKSDSINEAVVYRRQEQDKFVFLTLKPKSEAGQGWLRVDKNMFLYDPSVGKWERRSERERLANSDTRRADLDSSRYSKDFDVKYLGEDTLGKIKAHHMELTVKAGVDVAYPKVEIWAEMATGNLMKQLDYGESGKLMRSVYYPKWGKSFSEVKKADVYYPKEIRIFDELEKGNSSVVQLDQVELKALDANIFTKAWIESQSK